MGEEVYYKTVIHLSAKEMMLIYDKHPDCEYPMSIPRYDKTGIVMNLANIQSDFLLNTEKKYVFRKTGNKIKYDPDFDGDAEQKTARADHVLDVQRVNDLIMLNNFNSILAEIKEESDEDQTKAQNTATGETQTDSAPESTGHDAREKKADPAPGQANDQNRGKTTGSAHESTRRSAQEQAHNKTPKRSAQGSAQSGNEPNFDKTTVQFRMKTPKFDSQLPIENWICAMDIYKTCANLSDENIIKVSLTQILTEDSGTSLIESINAEERKN